jgi:hypothetical protein
VICAAAAAHRGGFACAAVLLRPAAFALSCCVRCFLPHFCGLLRSHCLAAFAVFCRISAVCRVRTVLLRSLFSAAFLRSAAFALSCCVRCFLPHFCGLPRSPLSSVCRSGLHPFSIIQDFAENGKYFLKAGGEFAGIFQYFSISMHGLLIFGGKRKSGSVRSVRNKSAHVGAERGDIPIR